MSQPHIPNGCYSVKAAAEILGIREINLIKKMCFRGWLYKGIFRKDPLKNMPLPDAIENGFVMKIKTNAPAPYNWAIAITKKGLDELGGKMPQQTIPKPAALTLENAQKIQVTLPTAAANEEREKCLRDLEAMGFPVRRAS